MSFMDMKKMQIKEILDLALILAKSMEKDAKGVEWSLSAFEQCNNLYEMLKETKKIVEKIPDVPDSARSGCNSSATGEMQ